MADAFYQQRAEHRFAATEHTAGPWSEDSQHFGPPAALLGRALQRVPAATDMSLARITVEILGPLPVAEVTVTAELTRPGRSVELVSAALRCRDRTVARATGWRIARSDTTAIAQGEAMPLPGPETGTALSRPDGWRSGYLDAVEWRSIAGGYGIPGPATVWCRPRLALVADEPSTGLQRALLVADSGNGVSNVLDLRTWYFINTELTVHLHREPEGEWIAMDATTVIGPRGVGTAHSLLHDGRGQFGHGSQALLVRRR